MSEACITPTQSGTIFSNIYNYLFGLRKATVKPPTKESADLYLLYITSHGEIIVTQDNTLDLINVPNEIDLTYIPVAEFGNSVELKTTCVNELCSNLQTQIKCDDKCNIIRNIKTIIDTALNKNVNIYDPKKIINKRYTQKMSDLRNTTEIHNTHGTPNQKNVDMNMMLYKYNIEDGAFEAIRGNLFEFFIKNKQQYKESEQAYKKRKIGEDNYIDVKNNVTFYDILKYFKYNNIYNVVVIDLGCNTIELGNTEKTKIIKTHYQQYKYNGEDNKSKRIGGYKKYTKRRVRNKKRKTKRNR